MNSPPTNNYAVMVSRARALFLTHDQAAMCARLGLAMTEDAIPLRFLGAVYTVRRSDGAVLAPGGEPADFNAAMTIYDALTHNKERAPTAARRVPSRDGAPALSGEWVPTSALHGIRGSHAVHEDLHAPAAQRFAGKCPALAAALEALGGRPGPGGDVSYILDVFDFFPVCVRFYDADEEFPASLQFLWDANALDFLYYETLWYVMDEVIDALTALI